MQNGGGKKFSNDSKNNKRTEVNNEEKGAHEIHRSSFFLQHVQDRLCLAFYTWGDKMKENTFNTA